MKKNVYKFLSVIILSVIISTSTTVNVFAAQDVKDPNNTSYLTETEGIQTLGPITEAERIAGEQKLKLAIEYSKSKEAKQLLITPMSAGGYKVIYVPYSAEYYGYFCGPAAAYSSIVAKKSAAQTTPLNNNIPMTQTTLALDLGTNTNGTIFPTRWASTMNKFLWENNYVTISGGSYSDWQSKLRSSIIYTIDKGYPVIADTKQDVGGIKLNPGYSYIDDRGPGGISTLHYVSVAGYDNTSGNDQVIITDSHTNPNIPASYWTSTSNLAAVSKTFGIVY